MVGQENDKKWNRTGSSSTEGPPKTPLARKKLSPHFVDEVTNISIAPNGACRLYFSTWGTDDNGAPLRVDGELIMTRSILGALADALPKALAQADACPHLNEQGSTSGEGGL